MGIAFNERELTIGVVGPTGSGKTSLTRELGRLLGFRTYLELPEDNPYLDRYYKDIHNSSLPSKWAYHSQLHFLLASVEQGKTTIGSDFRGAVWDVPPAGHRMYAVLAHEQGIMSDDDFELYERTYQALVGTIIEPEITLVMSVNLDTLIGRIVSRASQSPERQNEMHIDSDYWARQINYWEHQLREDQTGRLVSVNSGAIDWVNGNGAVTVLNEIRSAFSND